MDDHISKRPHILFVLTSHDQIGDTGKKCGWWLSEFAHPYHVLSPHTDITVASPAGGTAPLDPNSVQACQDDPECTSFLQEKEYIWSNTKKLANLVGEAKAFEVVFFVGGHGPMYDLATLAASHDLVREIHNAKRIVAAVCHGPAAISKVKLDDGSYLIANSAVTGFTNAEEMALGFEHDMPFALEDTLEENSSGGFRKAEENFGPCVVVSQDGRLMTGQNPASAKPLAEAILKRLIATQLIRHS